MKSFRFSCKDAGYWSVEIVYEGTSSEGQRLKSWDAVERMVMFYGNVLEGKPLNPILVLFLPMFKVEILIAGGYF